MRIETAGANHAGNLSGADNAGAGGESENPKHDFIEIALFQDQHLRTYTMTSLESPEARHPLVKPTSKEVIIQWIMALCVESGETSSVTDAMSCTIFIDNYREIKPVISVKAKTRRGFAHETALGIARGARAGLLACAFLSGFTGAAAAACRDGAPAPEARTIIGLYDSREEPDPRDTRLHHFLELPLNHLGYIIEYHDIAAGAPPARLSADTAAVATWFQAPLANVAAY
ncbi:MAG: hypothetical protein ACK5MQ_11720, partial [Pikeienuella sp.]